MSVTAEARRRAERDERHGVPGQLSIYALDVETDQTGYGQHNRLLVFGPGVEQDEDRDIITIREDLRGLPLSTDEQRRKAANSWQRMHPKGTRLVYVGCDRGLTDHGESIWHHYRMT